MTAVGRQDMKPLSLETISFMKIIRRRKIPVPTATTLVAPLMKQWLSLINIISNYRVMSTTINITNAAGMPITKSELLERAEIEVLFLPSSFDSIVVRWAEYLIPPEGLADGIEIITPNDDPILFDWGYDYDYHYDYNYDSNFSNFSRVYYKDGKVNKEDWLRKPTAQKPSADEYWMISRNTMHLCEDGALIWCIPNLSVGVPLGDLIMKI
jgi:hypothetical protein